MVAYLGAADTECVMCVPYRTSLLIIVNMDDEGASYLTWAGWLAGWLAFPFLLHDAVLIKRGKKKSLPTTERRRPHML
eukprot:scaffold2709_cov163-Ochromonas_danica.AAC.12